MESCLIPDCNNAGTHHAPGGSERQWLCCEHFEQFIGHLLDPVRTPVFPLPPGCSHMTGMTRCMFADFQNQVWAGNFPARKEE
jgi:hypothetical protein